MTEFTTELKPWEREIVNKYPLVYLEPNAELLQWYTIEQFDSLIKHPNFCNLRYGFECGSGWAKLIDELSHAAQELVTILRKEETSPDACIKSLICKEKFGILAFQGSNNLVEPFKSMWRAYESHVENKSLTTCELTGEPGCLCKLGSVYKTVSYEMGTTFGYTPVRRQDVDYWKYLKTIKEPLCETSKE